MISHELQLSMNDTIEQLSVSNTSTKQAEGDSNTTWGLQLDSQIQRMQETEKQNTSGQNT